VRRVTEEVAVERGVVGVGPATGVQARASVVFIRAGPDPNRSIPVRGAARSGITLQGGPP
jgi:hypothetical protein